MKRNTVREILSKKKSGKKITVLTAYDYPLAALIDQAGIDIILVGDSLANVVLGLDSTKEVGMDEMIHHSKAVSRAVKKAMVVGDMPFDSYQINRKNAVKNAKRFIKEAGCDAVKLEWFDHCLEVTENVIKAGIPVMGHVGLTPQTLDKIGGYKIQGKDSDAAREIIERAMALEKRGCFSIVLECIPAEVAKMITKKLSIPTIGIGAGIGCDGQVIVTYDLLGLFSKFHPKFVKQYANLSDIIGTAVRQYRQEVLTGKFPDDNHSYSIDPSELEKLFKEVE